jgi:hypothetical protein
MKKETTTMKIKAFNNAEIISFNIVGKLKDKDNISLNPAEFNLVYTAVIETIKELGKNNLLTHDVGSVLN